MSPNAEPIITNDPENPIVNIDRRLFARIEEQQIRVSETDIRLRRAAEDHKDAKKAHEAATTTLTALVAAMVRKVNGEPSDTPLFDNMNDAIDAAESDPVVTKLLSRMLDHGISHVNALIVAGYDEAQLNELSTYLDAMDARKVALQQPEGFEPVPEVEVPAFLQPDATPEVTDQEVIDALAAQKIALKKKHIRLLTAEHRAVVMEWTAAMVEVQTRLGEAVTFDDLPPAPSFVINPTELEPRVEEAEATEAAAEEPAPKKARTPRRSSKTFKNTPRVAGKVTKAKGRKREAVQ